MNATESTYRMYQSVCTERTDVENVSCSYETVNSLHTVDANAQAADTIQPWIHVVVHNSTHVSYMGTHTLTRIKYVYRWIWSGHIRYPIEMGKKTYNTIQTLSLSAACSPFFVFSTQHKTGVLRKWHAYRAYCSYSRWIECQKLKKKIYSTKTKTEPIDIQLYYLFLFSVSFEWILMSTVTHRNDRWRQCMPKGSSFHFAHTCALPAPIEIICLRSMFEDDEVSLVCQVCTHRTNIFYSISMGPRKAHFCMRFIWVDDDNMVNTNLLFHFVFRRKERQ